MLRAKDVYPQVEESEAISKLREITNWIESLPISNLPYVEMGFDTLSTDLTTKI